MTDFLTTLALSFAFVSLVACWAEIRTERYFAERWRKAATDARVVAETSVALNEKAAKLLYRVTH